MTEDQLVAFTAFGLMIINGPQDLLEVMSIDELTAFAAEVDKHLSPLVENDADIATPIVNILRKALKEKNT